MRVKFYGARSDGLVGELWVNRKTRISPTYDGECVTVDVHENVQQSYFGGTDQLIFTLQENQLLVNFLSVEGAAAGLSGDTPPPG